MDQAKIYAELTEIFLDVFDLDQIQLTPSMTARDLHGWDSFKQIEIIASVEERFQVEFSTKDVDALNSVGDLAELIGRMKS